MWGQGLVLWQPVSLCLGNALDEAAIVDVLSPAALSPAPVLSLKPASQAEPAPALLLTPSGAVASTPVREPVTAPVPVLPSSPVVTPASELEPAPEPPLEAEPSLALAPELDPAVSQSLELESAPLPAPALEPSWPLSEATENGLDEKPHLLLFPPDLVAEQFTLMDAVSGWGRDKTGFLCPLLSRPVFWFRAYVPGQVLAPLLTSM